MGVYVRKAIQYSVRSATHFIGICGPLWMLLVIGISPLDRRCDVLFRKLDVRLSENKGYLSLGVLKP